MKKIILILLLIPFLSMSQKKKVLKEQIIQKNDSLTFFISQIQDLNISIDSLSKEHLEFEEDINKLLLTVSDEKHENQRLLEEFSRIKLQVIELENDLTSLKIEKNNLIDSISRYVEVLKLDNEKLLLRLKEQNSTVMYQPAVFHSENPIEDSGGEYFITFSLHAEDCFCDKHTFISFGAAEEYIKPGKVYMFGLTYEFSDAGYLYNFISDVRELTKEELDAGYADPSIY